LASDRTERNHDAKIIGLLIDDPKQLTRDQVEKQVDGTGPGMLSHVLSSCDATLPKSPVAFEIAKGWMASRDPVRHRQTQQKAQRRCDQGRKSNRPDSLQRRGQEVRADERAQAPDQRLLA
jgi:hypothetical protein